MANKVLLSSAGCLHLRIQLRALLTSALAFLTYTNSQCTAASASRKLSNFPAAGRYKSSVSARSQSLRPPTLNLNTVVSVSVTQASSQSEVLTPAAQQHLGTCEKRNSAGLRSDLLNQILRLRPGSLLAPRCLKSTNQS